MRDGSSCDAFDLRLRIHTPETRRRSVVIPDTELIRLAYSGTESVRRYAVTYADGSKVYLAVETKDRARRVGIEYGFRFGSGARIVGIERIE